MKKGFGILCSFMISMCLVFASSAKADESYLNGFYIAPKVMLSIGLGKDLERNNNFNDDDHTSTKFGGGLAIGHDFKKSMDYPFRIEFEYMIRDSAHFNLNNDSIKARHPQTLMINSFYDIHNSTDFIPYFTAGTGVAFLDKKGSFAWNAGTGVAYKINENWVADLGYRFVRMGDFKDNNYKGDLYSNEFVLSARYTF